jgi:hypothetical protein
MDRFIETMALLRREPDNWLAAHYVSHIKSFIAGFMCVDVLGDRARCFTPVINGLYDYMEEKHPGMHDEAGGWSDSSADSMDWFFVEWEGFCAERLGTISQRTLNHIESPVVDFTGTLRYIRRRPLLYSESPSISHLFSFVRGVLRSCECYAKGACVRPDMKGFEDWLSDKHLLTEVCRWDRYCCQNVHSTKALRFIGSSKGLMSLLPTIDK